RVCVCGSEPGGVEASVTLRGGKKPEKGALSSRQCFLLPGSCCVEHAGRVCVCGSEPGGVDCRLRVG
ncbi:MAG: hypothetical protein U1E05_13880, partial [Patescibacteria group bacterium]|nr:hypothetical protein [Patescibacteria group bacterium]